MMFSTFSNFNSHAHVERDLKEVTLLVKHLKISTHTLTWSVTSLLIFSPLSVHISTHTLTWSVTVAGGGSNQRTAISTHTLTWSVTVYFTALAL